MLGEGEAVVKGSGASVGGSNRLPDDYFNGFKTAGAALLFSGVTYFAVKKVAGYLMTGIGLGVTAAVIKYPEYRTADVRANFIAMANDATKKVSDAVFPYIKTKNGESDWLTDLAARVWSYVPKSNK